VTNHPAHTRRNSSFRSPLRRVAALILLVPALLVTSLTDIASADAPVQWEDNGKTSPLYVLLVLVVIPVGLFALITLLVYLPSMMHKGESYQPGQPWRNEAEWFGGPRGGVGAVDKTEQPLAVGRSDHPQERGGASGQW
jgi:hypothetical protein